MLLSCLMLFVLMSDTCDLLSFPAPSVVSNEPTQPLKAEAVRDQGWESEPDQVIVSIICKLFDSVYCFYWNFLDPLSSVSI